MNRRYARLGASLAAVVMSVGAPLWASHPALADQQSPMNGSVGVGDGDRHHPEPGCRQDRCLRRCAL